MYGSNPGFPQRDVSHHYGRIPSNNEKSLLKAFGFESNVGEPGLMEELGVDLYKIWTRVWKIYFLISRH